MPEQRPLASIVIPTRNRRMLVAEAIASVRAQTYPRWELIVVDDCSEDDTSAYLSSLADPRIRTVRLGHHSERSAARNRGLSGARGEYILFLDDDDRLRPHALACLVATLERRADAAFAAGGRVLFDGYGNRKPMRHSRVPLVRPEPWRDVLVGWASLPGETLFRVGTLHAVGGWNEHLAGPEDQELLLRVGLVGACCIVPTVVLENRAHAGQWRARDTIAVEDAFRRAFVNSLDGSKRQTGERLLRARMLLRKAAEAYQDRDFSRTSRCLWTAARTAPEVFASPLLGPGLAGLWGKSLLGSVIGRNVFQSAKALRDFLRRWRREEVKIEARSVEGSARIPR